MKFTELEDCGIRIEDVGTKIELNHGEMAEMLELYFEGHCQICNYVSSTPICCDCLKEAIAKHRKELHGCV